MARRTTSKAVGAAPELKVSVPVHREECSRGAHGKHNLAYRPIWGSDRCEGASGQTMTGRLGFYVRCNKADVDGRIGRGGDESRATRRGTPPRGT